MVAKNRVRCRGGVLEDNLDLENGSRKKCGLGLGLKELWP